MLAGKEEVMSKVTAFTSAVALTLTMSVAQIATATVSDAGVIRAERDCC